jgi:hypothetical protein
MRAVLVEVGLPPDLADENLAMNAAFNAGTVRSLAGRGPATSTPTTLEDWARTLAPVS